MKQKVLTMIGFVFCIVTLLPGIAFANDNTTEVTEFTPELAVQSAQSFADSAYSEEELIAFNPMIFFDEEGKALDILSNSNMMIHHLATLFSTTQILV